MGVALVVLGCRVGPTLARRASATVLAWESLDASLVVASGGRTWMHQRVITMESDWLARELVDRGVPAASVVRERCSYTTRENARFTRELLVRRGIDRVTVVTCAWHLPRATALFEREGLVVQGWTAGAGPSSPLQRSYRRAREWVALKLDGARS